MALDSYLSAAGTPATTATVRQAANVELAAHDPEFVEVVRRVRRQLLDVAGGRGGSHEAVLLEGPSTFALEASLGTLVPRHGGVLVVSNGTDGERLATICSALGITHEVVRCDEVLRPSISDIEDALAERRVLTHVAVVHCETTTGIVNDVTAVARATARSGCSLIVDATYSFGALPIELAQWKADAVVASSSHCLQGLPGCAFALVARDRLERGAGRARSLSLDLRAQWMSLEREGHFRFTPPVQAVVALDQALRELAREGGPAGRLTRYQSNHRTLLVGLCRLGLEPMVRQGWQGPIVTAFHYPRHQGFVFAEFASRLADRGFVVSPGLLAARDSFRVGTMGTCTAADVERLLSAIQSVLLDAGVALHTAR
jgi:2-aminoethylphosphonate-pyruvate transaminase